MKRFSTLFFITLLLLLTPYVATAQNSLKKNSREQKTGHADRRKDNSKNNKLSYGTVNRGRGNVVLICMGGGKTINDATLDALRNGIEEAYGAFISSNTKIFNDRQISDEIVSISSGNIVAYKVISSDQINGNWAVTVEAELSQSNLATFAYSKGYSSSASINTSAYAMDIKLKQVYADNRRKAIRNLEEYFVSVAPFCFDYFAEISEPDASYYGGWWDIWVDVGYRFNENYYKAMSYVNQNFKSMGETIPRELIFELSAIIRETADNNYILFRDGKDITKQDSGNFSFSKEPFEYRDNAMDFSLWNDNRRHPIVKRSGSIPYFGPIYLTPHTPASVAVIKNQYDPRLQYKVVQVYSTAWSSKDESSTKGYASMPVPNTEEYCLPGRDFVCYIDCFHYTMSINQLASFAAEFNIEHRHNVMNINKLKDLKTL